MDTYDGVGKFSVEKCGPLLLASYIATLIDWLGVVIAESSQSVWRHPAAPVQQN